MALNSLDGLEQQGLLPQTLALPVALAANNTAQANGVALVGNSVNIITGGNGIGACVLPTAAPGQVTGVYNANNTGPLLIFPPANGTIGLGATNASTLVGPGAVAYFLSANSTDYSPLGASQGNNTQGPTTTIPAAKFTSSTMSSANGIVAGTLTGAAYTTVAVTAATPGTCTTRTAAQLLGDIPGAANGFSYMLRIVNTSANTLTFAAGTNVTFTGTSTVATNVTRDYCVTFTSPTAVTFQSVGAGSSP